MTRRKLIWAIVAAVVFFTVGFFLSGEARAATTVTPGSATGDYGFLLIVGAVVGVLHWQAARHIWRSLRNAKRVVDEAGEVVARRHAAEKATFDQWSAEARAALDANKNRNLVAKYESYAGQVYAAHRELENDRLIEDVVRQWSKENQG